ncbi:hypothetical protein B0H19DRAFT_1270587 [Mycena capillaripes]|nr:hypothetical protein B0H19DRAFT_1270587 [Mycena capillaripes]
MDSPAHAIFKPSRLRTCNDHETVTIVTNALSFLPFMNMQKWSGAEGIHGLGGGIVSAASQEKSSEKAEDLCQKRRPNEAVPFLMEAMKDPNNLDADLQMPFLCDRPMAMEVLEQTERRGRDILKQRLGLDAFSDDSPHVGKFFMTLETRPYMRILQAQVHSVRDTMIEMLRLCPADGMNQRSGLGSLLLRVGRNADALHFAQVWIDATAGDGIPPPRGGTVFQAPRRELFSEERERKLSEPYWSPAIQMHTAALASFRLWGACAQASQYLRIAARGNPHILSKILGRRSRPGPVSIHGMNLNARGINSPEEAHDYRWLTQDLWTETPVWNWITSDAAVNAELLKICSHPDCTAQETKATQFKRCAGCRQVTYCGPVCQKADWKRHKTECREHLQLKKTIKEFEANKPNTTKIPIVRADLATSGMSVASNFL